MNQQRAIELLQAQVRDYARQRAKDVARGAETPRLAALLVQKYGKGVVDALAVVFDSARSADPVMAAGPVARLMWLPTKPPAAPIQTSPPIGGLLFCTKGKTRAGV